MTFCYIVLMAGVGVDQIPLTFSMGSYLNSRRRSINCLVLYINPELPVHPCNFAIIRADPGFVDSSNRVKHYIQRYMFMFHLILYTFFLKNFIVVFFLLLIRFRSSNYVF